MLPLKDELYIFDFFFCIVCYCKRIEMSDHQNSKLSKGEHVCVCLVYDNYVAFTSQKCPVNYKNVSPEHNKQ